MCSLDCKIISKSLYVIFWIFRCLQAVLNWVLTERAARNQVWAVASFLSSPNLTLSQSNSALKFPPNFTICPFLCPPSSVYISLFFNPWSSGPSILCYPCNAHLHFGKTTQKPKLVQWVDLPFYYHLDINLTLELIWSCSDIFFRHFQAQGALYK